MKNKIIASLFLGLGLVIAATSGHAKSSHSTNKKHSHTSIKHGKKQVASSSKRGKAKKSSKLKLAAHPKKSGKKLSRLRLAKKSHTHKKHRLKSTAQAQVDVSSYSNPDSAIETNFQIENDFQNSQNPFTPEPVRRIHKIIKVGDKVSLIEEPQHDESPHHYLTAQGIIRTSFADAAEEIGLPESLVDQLASIFAWDIDFAANLRHGDQFTVVYENDFTEGPIIVAAEFVNINRILTAVRYLDEFGSSNYYTPEGKAMRKTFLSTPVEFARISSHFNINRRHPILNRIRAHKGVDYAARTGTPVKTTGDGTIAFLGRKGGYGQVIIVQHGERYETLYAHLSRFKRNLHQGETVKQGEIIGYVGQTGLATGPHLHYEFRVDGKHRNPELIQSSRNAMTLNNHQLVDFKRQAQPLLAQLYQAKAKSLLVRNQFKTE